MTAPLRADCDRCGTRVLATPAGRLLTAEPTRLGLHDPKIAERLHPRDVITRVRSTGLASHSEHECPTGQASLFEEVS